MGSQVTHQLQGIFCSSRGPEPCCKLPADGALPGLCLSTSQYESRDHASALIAQQVGDVGLELLQCLLHLHRRVL